ncbi:MAG: TonB-dependent receptor [Pseudomonadota bacterium]
MSRSVLIALLLTTCSSAALAQTVGGGGSIALPTINVEGTSTSPFDPYAGKFDGTVGLTSDITGTNLPILDTPRSVYVVTPQTIQQQMPQNLVQAVQTIPGTYLGQDNGGNSDFITIKGFQVNTSDSILIGNNNGILIDGIRSPFDRAFSANTQSVELLSGPASYLYGYSSEGGVINLQSKLPLPDAHYAVGLLGGEVTGSLRDAAGTSDFTGPIYKSTEGVLAYRLVTSGSADQPWRIGDTVSRDFLMAPTLAWYSDLFTATLAYQHEKNQQPYDRGDTSLNDAPLGISRTESYSEPFSTWNEDGDWVHGKVDYNLNKNNDFHFKYSYASTTQDFNEVRSDSQSDFNPATGNINRYFYTNVPGGGLNLTQGFTSFTGIHRFDLGPLHDEFQEGIDYYDAYAHETTEYEGPPQAGFNLYNPVYGQLNTGNLLNLGQLLGEPLNVQKERELGVFFQDAVTYGPVTVTGGGRYASIYEYEKYFGGVETNTNFHPFLPSASILYKINESNSLFADYSQSYTPNIYAIGQGVHVTFAGPSLPEIGTGYEAGIKSKFFGDRVLAQFSTFLINKTDAQTETETGEIEDQQGQRSEGVALSVVGNVTPNLNINVSYTHQHAYVTSDLASADDTGAQLINAPANIYTVQGAYAFLDGYLNGLTLIAGFTGATENAVDPINTFFLPSWTIANIGASYTWQPGPKLPVMNFSIKVNNLFDATYYPATGSKTNWITVGEPRNILFGLSASL